MVEFWGASPVSCAVRLVCGGLVLSGCVFQVGVSSHKSPRRGGRDCRPRGGADPPAIPEDDSLLPGSAKWGVTQPGFSQSLGGGLHSSSYTVVKPERSEARPAQALVSERVLVCAWPRVSRKA